MPVTRAHLEVLANLKTGSARHHGVGNHHIRVDIVQANQRRVGTAYGDYLVSFFAQDTLAHSLGVRAVIDKQDAAHFFFFFCWSLLLSFIPAGAGVELWPDWLAAAAAAACSGVWPAELRTSGFWSITFASGWTATTSPLVAVAVPAAVGGMLSGIVGRKPVICGLPDLAACDISGRPLNGPQTLPRKLRSVRFSISYFMRAYAIGSASGIGRFISVSLAFASSTCSLSG